MIGASGVRRNGRETREEGDEILHGFVNITQRVIKFLD